MELDLGRGRKRCLTAALGGGLRPRSARLIAAVAETLQRGEQTFLFLNRRGYAPVVLCRACGERLKAPDTDSWLVEHRYTGRLVCHLTGFSMPRPAAASSSSSLAMASPATKLSARSSDAAADSRATTVADKGILFG